MFFTDICYSTFMAISSYQEQELRGEGEEKVREPHGNECFLKLVSPLLHRIYHQDSLVIAVTPAPPKSIRRALLSYFQESYNIEQTLSISYNYLSNSTHKRI